MDLTLEVCGIEAPEGEASVVTWYFDDGDGVTQGAVLCDVAVEKSQFELIAPADGKLEILIQPEVPFEQDAVICRLA